MKCYRYVSRCWDYQLVNLDKHRIICHECQMIQVFVSSTRKTKSNKNFGDDINILMSSSKLLRECLTFNDVSGKFLTLWQIKRVNRARNNACDLPLVYVNHVIFCSLCLLSLPAPHTSCPWLKMTIWTVMLCNSALGLEHSSYFLYFEFTSCFILLPWLTPSSYCVSNNILYPYLLPIPDLLYCLIAAEWALISFLW